MLETRRAFYFQLATIGGAIGLFIMLSRSMHLVDAIGNLQERVIRWGTIGAMIYPLVFALCNILLLPGGILCVGSGFFFGLWWGFFIVLVGNAISAAVSFTLSRWVGREWFRRKLSGHSTLRALEPAVEREGWKIILLTQLHPLFPTSLINYFFGLTRIRFRTYMLWVSIGRAPGLFLYVYLGTLGQYGLNLARGKTHPRLVEYWTWGGAFVLSALLLLVLSRIARRAIRRSHAENQPRELVGNKDQSRVTA